MGDRRTSYYHAKASKRRWINRVMVLKDERGQWCTDVASLEQMASSFFKRLCRSRYSPSLYLILRHTIVGGVGLFPPLNHAEMESLNMPVTMEERRKALFDMKPLKAPGPDGLHAAFFQSQWQILGSRVRIGYGQIGISRNFEVNFHCSCA